MKCAVKCALMLLAASVACLIHSFLPFVFKKTATKLASCVINARCKKEEEWVNMFLMGGFCER